MKHIFNISKLTIISLAIVIFFCITYFGTVVFAEERYNFANFSEEDSMEFVEQCNIAIPKELLEWDELPSFTQKLITQSYYNPDTTFHYNYSVTQQYADSIRTAVKLHINNSDVPAVANDSSYSLQYNTVMDENGNWVTQGGYYNEKWGQYNCYAYAIHRAEQPGFYTTDWQYEPGNMSGTGTFVVGGNIADLANLVRDDLIAMGYSNITLSSTIPEITAEQELICVRRSAEDYHFMRYDIVTDAWYHKQGGTAILKYNYVPSNELIWYTEYSYNSHECPLPDIYDSDIVFITYSKNQINVVYNNALRMYIQPSKDIFCELNFANVGNYDVQLKSAYSVEYEIYNMDFDEVLSGEGATIDTYFPAENNKYYLRVNFEDCSERKYVDIRIKLHDHKCEECTYLDSALHTGQCACGNVITEEHSYEEFAYYNARSHTATCKCGYQRTLAHWVRPTSGRYANCVDCGALIDLGGTITPVNPFNIRKVSVNGSYILPNGIAVIVDADEEAYRNGTLVFYDPSDVPVTQ